MKKIVLLLCLTFTFLFSSLTVFAGTDIGHINYDRVQYGGYRGLNYVTDRNRYEYYFSFGAKEKTADKYYGYNTFNLYSDTYLVLVISSLGSDVGYDLFEYNSTSKTLHSISDSLNSMRFKNELENMDFTYSSGSRPYIKNDEYRYFSTTIPCFKTQEEALAYCADTKNESGIENVDTSSKSDNSVYNSQIGVLYPAGYKEYRRPLKQPDYDIFWKIDKLFDLDCFVEVRADVSVKYSITKSEIFEMELYSKDIKARDLKFSDTLLRFEEEVLKRNNVEKRLSTFIKYWYIRPIRFDKKSNKWEHGLWTRIDVRRGNSETIPDFGNDVGDFDTNTGDFIPDVSYPSTSGSGTTGDFHNWDFVGWLQNLNISKIFLWFINTFNFIKVQLSSYFDMLTSVFVFIPSEIGILVGIGITVAIILRIVGR